jgi:hypothetical protein
LGHDIGVSLDAVLSKQRLGGVERRETFFDLRCHLADTSGDLFADGLSNEVALGQAGLLIVFTAAMTVVAPLFLPMTAYYLNLLMQASTYAVAVLGLDGPKTRGTDRKTYRLTNGEQFDIYPIVLRALALDPPALTHRYNNLVLLFDLTEPLRAKIRNLAHALLVAKENEMAQLFNDLFPPPHGLPISVEQLVQSCAPVVRYRQVNNFCDVALENDPQSQLKQLRELPQRWINSLRELVEVP